SEEQFYRVNQALRQRRNHGPDRVGHGAGRKGEDYNNLFSGLATCAYCGSKVRYENKGTGPKGGSYLICCGTLRGMKCDALRWRYKQFQDLFLIVVHRNIDLKLIVHGQPQHEQLHAIERKIDAITERKRRLEDKRERAYNLWMEDQNDDYAKERYAGFKNGVTKVDAELANAEQERNSVKEQIRLKEQTPQHMDIIKQLVAAFWEDQTFEKRSKLATEIRTVVKEIVIAPNGYQDQIAWVRDDERKHVADYFDVSGRKNLRYFVIRYRDGVSAIIHETTKGIEFAVFQDGNLITNLSAND